MFRVFDKYNGLIDKVDGTEIYAYQNMTEAKQFDLDGYGSFGYVAEGSVMIGTRDEKEISVGQGFWFTVDDGFLVIPEEPSRIVIWRTENYPGVLTMGIVEDDGRLKYIDGCTDSMLSSPIKKGMPCLNALYMPEGVNQTMHTHPSLRSGFIIKGGAKCETPEGTYNLEDNQVFILDKDYAHKFRTDFLGDIVMKLVAYHPDSDFGPEDEEHPMINRTIVDGKSAKDIDSIKTK